MIVDRSLNKKIQLFIKRLLDICAALFALTICSPIYLIVTLYIKLNSEGPIFFKQERAGFMGKPFICYKFRTMTDDRDENGNLLPDSARLTKFGKFLRSTSLDELPELFNILKGDMSIIGPRPLSIKYLPYYNDIERLRHSVQPGLTGLAQINGRNSLSWEEKFKFDVRYVNEISFIKDIEIIIKTVLKVIKRSDIGQAENAPESFHIVRQRQIKK